ncbi:TRAP transporter fused permease subunit [Geomicrobium sediminis]|uniref:TRAP transporter 4TM/12TM fusion protein n=1 Tax=Geomicrobium sediminis TaxID=1347788 RepID=A0ABS2PBR7_9BACL|nr:TRAP transporter 4TM/12TM fusion protein [Geomicrobium sediminis]
MKKREKKEQLLSTPYRKEVGVHRYAIIILSLAFCFFHLYTAGFEMLVAYQQRSVHLAFGMTLLFLCVAPTKTTTQNRTLLGTDVIFAALSLGIGVYAYFSYYELVGRVGNPNTMDLILGTLLIFLLLEATRRMAGKALTLIAGLFLIYAFVGPYLPGLLSHRGYGFERIVNQMFLTNEGIFGITLGVSASYVFLFIMFGTFLEVTGAGKFFLNLSIAFFGRMTGGPAKAAVIGSSLFGTVSGSAAANVSGTGPVTIPLMKRLGYNPKFAGAVESVASAGGQLVPPIMGAAAFIMVDILRLPYTTIILAAIIPAVLYYLSTMVVVHLQSKRQGLIGVPAKEMPDLKATLKNGIHLAIPLLILVFLLAVVYLPPALAIFWSFLSLIVVAQLRGTTRVSVKALIDGFVQSAKNSMIVVIVTAVSGIVIGIINLTGLGLNISNLLVALAGGSLILLLILTMITSIILGMGLPTTAAYVILAVLVAPALVSMGVEPLAAHFFVFYFGIVSAITPPVAVAPFIASGIANTSPMGTAMWALKIGLAAFIIPYMFVFNTGLLMLGSVETILIGSLSAIIGIVGLAIAIEGYLYEPIRIIPRSILIIGSLLMITPGFMLDLIGLLIILAVLSYLRWIFKKRNVQLLDNTEGEHV